MKYIGLLVIILASFGKVNAQETLAQEISYEYLDKLVAIAKKNYPQIKSYDSRIEMGNLNVRRTKLSYFDIISLSYLYNPNQTTSGINPNFLQGYQFGFFVNIGSILQKPTQVQQAKAEVKITEFEKQTYERSLEADVRKRYFTLIQHQTILRLKSEALLDVESALKDARYRFEKGETTVQNYNTALLMYSTQLQTKITSEADVYIAKSSLEELLGQKLEDTK
ncbi:MAG TPA: TolC family protein [Dyadobacter sp.]|jgi:outer membrane protein TolC|nr:TolC family protein [Dyadobacter sp.]